MTLSNQMSQGILINNVHCESDVNVGKSAISILLHVEPFAMLLSRISTGREFKALFISTMECVKDGFQSANPTKSFCSRYVFNTALTRAKSLVVCAGNPFQLLKVEAAMPDYVGCWREYIKRCLENGTFVVPARVGNRDHVIEQLTQKGADSHII